MFLRTKSNELISLARLYEIEHAAGGHTVIAVLRGSGAQVELARDYSVDSLARALDPVRASR